MTTGTQAAAGIIAESKSAAIAEVVANARRRSCMAAKELARAEERFDKARKEAGLAYAIRSHGRDVADKAAANRGHMLVVDRLATIVGEGPTYEAAKWEKFAAYVAGIIRTRCMSGVAVRSTCDISNAFETREAEGELSALAQALEDADIIGL